MVTNIIFLFILFLSGASDDCGKPNTALFITAPKEMRALSGSCLQVPCEFRPSVGQTFDTSKPFFGIWMKEDPRVDIKTNIVFNSSGAVRTYHINITGDMRQKNCTTLFSSLITGYTNKYYFRVENKKFKATAACDDVQINVQDVPWSPLIQIPGELKEKEQVTINCSAVTPCPQSPPKLTWGLKQESLNVLERHTNGTFTTKLQQTITLTDSHDGLGIKCSAVYPVNEGNKTADTNVTLNVTYAPKNTTVSVSPSGLLSAGQLVNLSCSSRAKPPVHSFTWFKMSSEGPVSVSEGDFYSFLFSDVTQGQYYCEAMNKVGKHASAVIHLQTEVKVEVGASSSPWAALAAGIVGALVLTCVLVLIWRFKWTHKTSQPTQSLTAETAATAGDNEIHYGQIDFSKLRCEPSGQSVQHNAQGQDTVYAQVNVSKLTDTSAIYAQVKKR